MDTHTTHPQLTDDPHQEQSPQNDPDNCTRMQTTLFFATRPFWSFIAILII